MPHCRPDVLQLFQSQLARLHETDALCTAVNTIAWQLYPSTQPDNVLQQFDQLAETILTDVQHPTPQALLAHLHRVLFDEQGFQGNTAQYDAVENSCLPRVLETKRGLPVLLCLVYKAVAERIGLTVEGLNTPGHFLAAVKTDDEWLIIDPFQSGRCLNLREASLLISQITGHPIPLTWDELPCATHQVWLARILLNLIGVMRREQRTREQLMLEELLRLVVPE